MIKRCSECYKEESTGTIINNYLVLKDDEGNTEVKTLCRECLHKYDKKHLENKGYYL